MLVGLPLLFAIWCWQAVASESMQAGGGDGVASPAGGGAQEQQQQQQRHRQQQQQLFQLSCMSCNVEQADVLLLRSCIGCNYAVGGGEDLEPVCSSCCAHLHIKGDCGGQQQAFMAPRDCCMDSCETAAAIFCSDCRQHLCGDHSSIKHSSIRKADGTEHALIERKPADATTGLVQHRVDVACARA
jgi:hypothetical protein